LLRWGVGEFYEWHVNPDHGKQPFYIHVDDQDVLGFAGLWARSRTDANTVTQTDVD
jgi:putative SOS response-associated peptidase YedK